MFKVIVIIAVVAIVAVDCRTSHRRPAPKAAKTEDSEIELVYVLFRHGDRTPVQYELDFVPNNIYANNSFEPYGPGQLMNKGKLRMHKRGAALRQRYDSVLGKIAYADTVKVYCTSTYRVQATSLVFLSGLWPPANEQKWNEKGYNGRPELAKLWSPIAYSLTDIEKPSVSYYKCPSYVEEFNEVLETPNVKDQFTKYDSLLATLSENIKKKVLAEDIIDLVNLYRSMKSYGLPVPKWVDSNWEQMLELLDVHSVKRVSNDELRKMAGGVLLSRLLNDTEAKSSDDEKYKQTKMIVYAVHDSTILGFLGALGGAGGFKKDGKEFFADYPNYGATVVVELHKNTKTGKYGYKVLYTNTVEPDFVELPMNDCANPCPVDDFVKLRGKTVINPEEFQNLCNGELHSES